MGDITVALSWLIEWYDDGNPQGGDLEKWAKYARMEIERAKIRVKHGNRFGEVILLGNVAFIIHDIDHEEKEISKAKIKEDGSLGTTQKSSLEELEKSLAKVEIPPKVFIKEPIFEDLKNIFGKDVEILVNY